MDEVVVLLIRGIGAGFLYALIAMSLNLIFNATGVLNFAQGQLLIIAGVLTYVLNPGGGPASLRWWTSFIVVVFALVVIAAVQGWLTLIPMRSPVDQHSWIMTTIAASIVMGATITLVIGPRTVAVGQHFGSLKVAGTTVPGVYPVLVILAFAVWAALRWYRRVSLTGMALSALSQDVDAARLAGVPTMPLQVMSFAIAGAVMGLSGFLGGHMVEVLESNALHYTVFGFIVAVIGGLGNNTGAMVAGPLFGILLVFSSYHLGGSTQILVALAAIVAVLMIKPQGIFGRPHARRV